MSRSDGPADAMPAALVERADDAVIVADPAGAIVRDVTARWEEQRAGRREVEELSSASPSTRPDPRPRTHRGA